MPTKVATRCLAVLLLVGCAGPNAGAPLSRLREPDGVCSTGLLRGGKTPFVRTELTAVDHTCTIEGSLVATNRITLW
jgi:hypothetical protein